MDREYNDLLQKAEEATAEMDDVDLVAAATAASRERQRLIGTNGNGNKPEIHTAYGST